MIRLRMSATDLERMRFAYSPLVEVAESLYMINAGRINLMHRAWFEMTRDGLRHVDMALLRAAVPPRSYLASFFLSGAADAATSIEQQLQLLALCPLDVFRAELETAWRGETMAPPAQQLLAEGAAGPRRLADALWQYWSVAIEPHWGQIRAVLDGDVAYRATRLAKGGIEVLLTDRHPELELADHAIQIANPRHSIDHDLQGIGLLLIPSVFAWPYLVVGTGFADPPSLTYGPRGIGELWPTATSRLTDDDALGALFGRSRAAILISLGLPRTTTELSRELGQSAPAVSAHLSTLRRNGLVTSWRNGRRVLYQRTPLATSVVAASAPALDLASDNPA